MQRRTFIRLAGGGVVAAAATAGAGAYALRSDYPDGAVEAWSGPREGTDARRWALAHAITAPNPHNLQPWLVDLREPQVITLFTDPQRVLPETDPFGRQILVGHGAFLELLVMALAQQGWGATVKLWPQGELPAQLASWDRRPVARIELSRGAVPDPLFAQVLRRHTPKVDFDTSRPVAEATLKSLLASHRGAMRADGTVDPAKLPPLRTLCLESALVEMRTPATAMESVRLMRVGPAEILRHRDGISLNEPLPRVADMLGMFDRTQPPPEGSPAFEQAATRFRGHSMTAMGFLWLVSPSNSRQDQVEAGRAYVRLQLKATELGLGVHPMSQALQEFPAMREHHAAAHRLLAGGTAREGAGSPTVQMFCRLGYTPKPVKGTPRRPLQAFVV